MSAEIAAHFVGDYVVQSDWMAMEKTSRSVPALAHALSYAAAFTPITRRWQPLAVIAGTHFVIDRWRLAKYVAWAKNQLAPAPSRHSWNEHVSGTGYHVTKTYGEIATDPLWDARLCDYQQKPVWMAVWLMIWADNAMHMTINHWALRRWR